MKRGTPTPTTQQHDIRYGTKSVGRVGTKCTETKSRRTKRWRTALRRETRTSLVRALRRTPGPCATIGCATQRIDAPAKGHTKRTIVLLFVAFCICGGRVRQCVNRQQADVIIELQDEKKSNGSHGPGQDTGTCFSSCQSKNTKPPTRQVTARERSIYLIVAT